MCVRVLVNQKSNTKINRYVFLQLLQKGANDYRVKKRIMCQRFFACALFKHGALLEYIANKI